ncbi:hypothetical protein [Terricaulis sp.]|uniref:hypothetical protein n=1 Tax=Terricaulis sp. TaxID=2768686 RepID=UPI00378388D0
MAEWPIGWRSVEGDERATLAAKLTRDMADAHILKDRAFTPIARRDDADDVLLQLDDGEVAEMNLAWAAQTNATFPGAILYVDVNDWREAQY